MKHIKKYENFFDKVSENIKIWKIRNNIKILEQKLILYVKNMVL